MSCRLFRFRQVRRDGVECALPRHFIGIGGCGVANGGGTGGMGGTASNGAALGCTT
ncbi:hypothetical protein KFZ76_08160 [Methylovulum psychrotolerans]|uniref:hypothetical protein n=1 Tax=Methylovulum psychrotolerans TaxID=1704499 RepID=UPI001BFF5F9C|nr:hypothetical protein [Methylovulum psychrotolerans]MBT9097679.1 hypothetical protein [Methylovulum psychrotolerans]